jgi:hypothetical protein
MLTDAQKLTLKAAIQADPSANAIYVNGDLTGLADYLNAAVAPAYWIWRSAVTWDEITQNGFDWVRVDNLSVGKARIWEWMFKNASQSINATKANIRAGIVEAWKGTVADLAVQAVVFGHCQRPATWIEKLFAVGAGT